VEIGNKSKISFCKNTHFLLKIGLVENKPMGLRKIYFPTGDVGSGFLVGWKIEEGVYFVVDVIVDILKVGEGLTVLGTVNRESDKVFELKLRLINGKLCIE
jgi:hypothetical protein